MIEKVLKYLYRPMKDKFAHGYYFLVLFNIGMLWDIYISLFVTIVLAIVKEVYDSRHDNHTVDIFDFIWSVFAPCVITILYWVFVSM